MFNFVGKDLYFGENKVAEYVKTVYESTFISEPRKVFKLKNGKFVNVSIEFSLVEQIRCIALKMAQICQIENGDEILDGENLDSFTIKFKKDLSPSSSYSRSRILGLERQLQENPYWISFFTF